MGVLLGKQSGRDIEITSSCDVCSDVVDGSWVLNRDYLVNRLDHLTQLAQSNCGSQAGDVVGWYAFGDMPAARHMVMHEQMSEIPVLLMFNHTQPEELALRTFEGTVDGSHSQSRKAFVEVPHVMKTSESERIGIDHAAGACVTGYSAVSDCLSSHEGAVSMLNGRVKVICDYLVEVIEGRLEPNPAVIKSISSLVSSLPLAKEHSQDFKAKTNQELLDVLLITTMSMLTKGIFTNQEVETKSKVFSKGLKSRSDLEYFSASLKASKI